MSWFVYIARTKSNKLYTGITTDPERRIHEHNHIKSKASKALWANRPVALVYFENHPTRSEASKREYQIKQFTRWQKMQLVYFNIEGYVN